LKNILRGRNLFEKSFSSPHPILQKLLTELQVIDDKTILITRSSKNGYPTVYVLVEKSLYDSKNKK